MKRFDNGEISIEEILPSQSQTVPPERTTQDHRQPKTTKLKNLIHSFKKYFTLKKS